MNDSMGCCKNELSLHKLCADYARIDCLEVCKFKPDHVCAQLLEGVQVNADSLNANKLCAQDANLNNLCVTNLNAPNFVPKIKFRAASTFNTDTVYTLGSVINWNVVLDDPNSNVSLSPFSYTVPVSGYYTLTFHMDHFALSGSASISGTPVGRLRMLVNGNELRTQYTPFLSFSDEQSTSLNSICLLNAGDKITMVYDVLVFDIVNGLQPYVGTVTIEANGSFAGQSGFAIHFLSGNPTQPPVSCLVCPPVVISCAHKEPGASCLNCL
jgi:hypothetical protein